MHRIDRAQRKQGNRNLSIDKGIQTSNNSEGRARKSTTDSKENTIWQSTPNVRMTAKVQFAAATTKNQLQV